MDTCLIPGLRQGRKQDELGAPWIPERKEVLNKQKDGGMSRGHQRQLKELSVAKAGPIRATK